MATNAKLAVITRAIDRTTWASKTAPTPQVSFESVLARLSIRIFFAATSAGSLDVTLACYNLVPTQRRRDRGPGDTKKARWSGTRPICLATSSTEKPSATKGPSRGCRSRLSESGTGAALHDSGLMQGTEHDGEHEWEQWHIFPDRPPHGVTSTVAWQGNHNCVVSTCARWREGGRVGDLSQPEHRTGSPVHRIVSLLCVPPRLRGH
jgi:hypothetical protein